MASKATVQRQSSSVDDTKDAEVIIEASSNAPPKKKQSNTSALDGSLSDVSLGNYLNDDSESWSFEDLSANMIKDIKLDSGSPKEQKKSENGPDTQVTDKRKKRLNLKRRKTVEELISKPTESVENVPEMMENGNRVVELTGNANERAIEDLSMLSSKKSSFSSKPINFEAQLQTELRHMHETELQHLSDITDIIKDKKKIQAAAGRHASPELFHAVQSIQSTQGWIVSILDNLCNKANTDLDALINKICERQQSLVKYNQEVPNYLRTLGSKASQNKIFSSEKKLITMLEKPMTWIMQTIENVKRLKSLVSDDDSAYLTLVEAEERLFRASNELEKDSKASTHKQPLKTSILVEMRNPQTGERRPRTIFLFDNVLVCAYQRVVVLRKRFTETDGEKSNPDWIIYDDETLSSKKMPVGSDPVSLRMKARSISTYELKWYTPLQQIKYLNGSGTALDEEFLKLRLKAIENLKEKIRNTREQLRVERENTDKESKRQKLKAPKIHHLRSSLHKLQADLVLQTPRLPIYINTMDDQSYCLLFNSERERMEWSTAIMEAKEALELDTPHEPAARKNTIIRNITSPFRSLTPKPDQPIKLSSSEVSSMINHYKKVISLNRLGTTLISANSLSGVLELTVHEITGLADVASYYVSLEVDCFGQLEPVGKTRSATNTANPFWNQSFMIELDCAQMISFTVYRSSQVIAQLDLNLSPEMIAAYSETPHAMRTFEPNSREINLKVSMSFTEDNERLPQQKSLSGNLVFGRPLAEIIKHDQLHTDRLQKIAQANRSEGEVRKMESSRTVKIPIIVVSCVEEIERRGLTEEGIYRVSGTSSSINYLKNQFNRDQKTAIKQIEDYDINSITGLLKLFFRELPEPLIDSASFMALISAFGLKDEKKKHEAYSKVLREVRLPAGDTFIYLLEHLVRVSQHEADTKMNLNNLSLIWAMTLFQPPPTVPTNTVDESEGTCEMNVSLAASTSVIQSQILGDLLNAIANSAIEFTSTQP